MTDAASPATGREVVQVGHEGRVFLVVHEVSASAGYALSVLRVLGTIWAAGWLLVSLPAHDMVSLTAVAAVAVLAVLAAGALRRAAGVGGGWYGVRTGVVVARRQTYTVPKVGDPDAAGRARPRAPTADLAA